jgi:hypothetical protein
MRRGGQLTSGPSQPHDVPLLGLAILGTALALAGAVLQLW